MVADPTQHLLDKDNESPGLALVKPAIEANGTQITITTRIYLVMAVR